MKQKLANFYLVYDEHKSTSYQRHVTPAELLVLVTQFHKLAKGSPVEGYRLPEGDRPALPGTLREIPEDTETKQLAGLQTDLEKVEKDIEELDEQELTSEIRERRAEAFQNRSTSLQDRISTLDKIIALRNLAPADERMRLQGKYGKKLIDTLFPGAIPQLPQDFHEAIRVGLGVELKGDSFDQHMMISGLTS